MPEEAGQWVPVEGSPSPVAVEGGDGEGQWVPMAPEESSQPTNFPIATAPQRMWEGFREKEHPLDSLVAAGQFLKKFVEHPIDTTTAAYLADKAARAKLAATANALRDAHKPNFAMGLYSAIPVLGPSLAIGQKKLDRGDVAGFLGSTLADVVNFQGPSILKEMKFSKVPSWLSEPAKNKARSMYRNTLSLPLSTKEADAVAMTEAGLKEGLPTRSKAGVSKAEKVIEDYEAENAADAARFGTQQVIGQTGVMRNVRELLYKYGPTSPTAPVPVSIPLIKKGPRGEILGLYSDWKNEFRTDPTSPMRKMSPAEAQARKVGAWQEIKTRKGQFPINTQASEFAYAVGSGLRDDVAGLIPEIGARNAKLGPVLKLLPELEKSVAKELGRKAPRIPIMAIAVGEFTRSGWQAAIAGAVEYAFQKYKSQLAIALYDAAEGTIPKKVLMARIQGYINGLNPPQKNSER